MLAIEAIQEHAEQEAQKKDDFVPFKTAMKENFQVDEQFVDHFVDSNSYSLENVNKILKR